jgi:Spy/CpxP family protein refolding chaperone
MNRITTRLAVSVLALSLAVSLGATFAATAQPATEGRPGSPFIRALRGGLATLGLTDDQKSEIKAVLLSKKEAGTALRQKMRADAKALHDLASAATPDPAAVGTAFLKVKTNREQARNMAEEALDEVKSVLTPDQATKLDGYFAAMKQLRRQRFGHPQ